MEGQPMKPSPSEKKGSPKQGRRHTRTALGVAVVVGAALAWGAGLMGGKSAGAEEVVVYKSPYCGCCGQWIKHMWANGFDVAVRNVDDVDPIKTANGIPPGLASCHTALVGGYVVEGHVPADLVQRLLAERPPARGLAVPGMPASAPGMDQPTGEPYTVLLVKKDGGTAAYARR